MRGDMNSNYLRYRLSLVVVESASSSTCINPSYCFWSITITENLATTVNIYSNTTSLSLFNLLCNKLSATRSNRALGGSIEITSLPERDYFLWKDVTTTHWTSVCDVKYDRIEPARQRIDAATNLQLHATHSWPESLLFIFLASITFTAATTAATIHLLLTVLLLEVFEHSLSQVVYTSNDSQLQ